VADSGESIWNTGNRYSYGAYKLVYLDLVHGDCECDCFIYGVSSLKFLEPARTYLNMLQDAAGEKAAAIQLFRSQDEGL